MRIASMSPLSAVLSMLVALATLADAQDPEVAGRPARGRPEDGQGAVSGATIRGVAKEKNNEGATVYEVEMTVKGKAIDIIVDAQGDIETIEEEIDAADLPKAVATTAARTFPKGKLTRAEKVTDEDKKVTYEVFVKVGDKDPFEVLMAKDGAILKDGSKPATKAEKKEEKDDDAKEEKAKKPKG